MTIIKIRRHTAATWTSLNPVLADGEQGLETDTRRTKFGDGTTQWVSLGYANAPTALPPGGVVGDGLVKASTADGDAAWVTPTPIEPVDGAVASVDYDGTTHAGAVVIPRNPAAGTAGLRTADGTTGSVVPYNHTAVGDVQVMTGFGVVPLHVGLPGWGLGASSGGGSVGGVGYIAPAHVGLPIIIAASGQSTTIKAMAVATGGAACTGTNDHLIIQAALTAQADSTDALHYQRPIVCTGGTFNFDTAAHPSGNGWKTSLAIGTKAKLRGAGKYATVFKLITNAVGSTLDPGSGTDTDPQANNAYMINNLHPDGSTVDANFDVGEFTLDGNSANQNRHHHGFVMWNQGEGLVERVNVQNMRGTSGSTQGETFFYDIKAGANVTFRDCRASGPGIAVGLTPGATASGFSTNQGTNITWENCVAEGLGVMGFTSYQAQGLTYTDCKARKNGAMGINAEGSVDVSITNCITGGAASAFTVGFPYTASQNLGNTSYGICLSPAAGVGCDRVTITGCQSSYNNRGVMINGCTNVKVIGGSYTHNDKGIVITGSGAATHEIVAPIFGSNTTNNIEVPGYSKVGGGTQYSINIGGVNPAPLVPASAATVASPFPFASIVYITGGTTLTSFSITDRNGVTTNLGGGLNRSFVVPYGATVTPVYTGTLTWQWAG